MLKVDKRGRFLLKEGQSQCHISLNAELKVVNKVHYLGEII